MKGFSVFIDVDLFPIIDSELDFKFGDTSVKSKGGLILMLRTLGSTPDIPVIHDVNDVEISLLLGFYTLDGNKLLVHKVANHLLSCITTKKVLVILEGVCNISLIRKDPISLFLCLRNSFTLYHGTTAEASETVRSQI